MNYLYPDYANCSVNLIASILDACGAASVHPPLPLYPGKSLGSYRHIFLIVFDGVGYQFAKEALEGVEDELSGFHKLSSVYPSTTAAAVTSFMTGQTPLEHGYLGWTLYLKEYNRYINALIGTDDEERVHFYKEGVDYHELFNPASVLEQIKGGENGRSVHYIAPEEFGPSLYTLRTSRGAAPLLYSREEEITELCRSIASGDAPSCTFLYSPFPDHFEHRDGIKSESVGVWIQWFRLFIAEISNVCRRSGSIALISSDHGMTDIEQYYRLEDDDLLMDTLVMPPFPEARFLSFFVKEHKKDLFSRRFTERFEEDFLLFSRQEFLDTGLLGRGVPHKKIDDLVGNYIAAAVGHTGIHCNPRHNPDQRNRFKANHAGLTPGEMEVPLIVIG